jgi:hypothetical protein
MAEQKSRYNKYVTGYRPVVRAQQEASEKAAHRLPPGRPCPSRVDARIRQPLDGPVFESLEDARNWCIHAMISHFDRRLGMSEACIEPFKGLVDGGSPPRA